ncbi:tetratricopeptide repeat protein [bacterium]|nr:tetratricopeptide repeat protein [bacterium]
MRPMTRTVRLVVCVALFAAFALSGCVYYNTFYHARTAYNEAESIRATRPPDSEPSSRETELLERVVEKSGRVLRLYPDSGWADDALLLMATALYRQEKYESAETRLAEFSRLHPDSDLAAEAEYMLAAVMLARDNPVSAEQTLSALAYADPPSDLSDDALVMIGRARHSRRRYDEAAEAYASALERFSESELRAEVRFLAAENFIATGRLEDAAHHFAAVGEERGARQLAYEARIRLAEVYLDIGELSGALDVLKDLEHRTTDRDDLDRVLLLRGRTQTAMGELNEAISTYEGIAASHAGALSRRAHPAGQNGQLR